MGSSSAPWKSLWGTDGRSSWGHMNSARWPLALLKSLDLCTSAGSSLKFSGTLLPLQSPLAFDKLEAAAAAG